MSLTAFRAPAKDRARPPAASPPPASPASMMPPQGGHNPKGSLKATGFDPAYAYRLTPPASPIGSCFRKRLSGPRGYDLLGQPLVWSTRRVPAPGLAMIFCVLALRQNRSPPTKHRSNSAALLAGEPTWQGRRRDNRGCSWKLEHPRISSSSHENLQRQVIGKTQSNVSQPRPVDGLAPDHASPPDTFNGIAGRSVIAPRDHPTQLV